LPPFASQPILTLFDIKSRKQRLSWLKLWLFGTLLANLSIVSLLFCQRAVAQVPGVFFPSAVGPVQEGFAPFPGVAPSDLPFYQSQRSQLESELGFLRRPYLNVISAYANQSLLPRPGQMDSFTPAGLEYGFYPFKQSQVQLFYLPTIFGTARLNHPREFGEEYRGVFRFQPTDRLKLHLQVGLFHFGQTSRIDSGLLVLGAAGFNYTINDRLSVMGGFRRDILGSNFLATAGLNLPGTNTLVGRVTQELFYVIANARLTRKTALSFYYGGGIETGSKVKTNPFQQFSLYLTRPLYTADVNKHISLILPAYQFLAQSWRFDLSGNGIDTLTLPTDPAQRALALTAAQLGATSLPTPPGQKAPGVGGYFSPQLFYLSSFNILVAGHLAGPVYYAGGGGVAVGSSKFTFGHLDQVGFGGGANASIFYRLGRNVKQEHGWFFLQGSNTYRRQVFYSETKYYF
jgi:hypothetical protein